MNELAASELRLDSPAKTIAVAMILKHQCRRGGTERFRCNERALPGEEIIERRIKRAGGMRHAHREKAGVFDFAILEPIAAHPLRQERFDMFVAGRVEAQRVEYVVAQIGLVALSGQTFDDMAEDHIGAVVVFEGAAGRKIERPVFGERDQFARAAIKASFLREKMW